MTNKNGISVISDLKKFEQKQIQLLEKAQKDAEKRVLGAEKDAQKVIFDGKETAETLIKGEVEKSESLARTESKTAFSDYRALASKNEEGYNKNSSKAADAVFAFLLEKG
jgi:vacuolar-type H+-ATPase subunit H